jgi:hypothetical protein
VKERFTHVSVAADRAGGERDLVAAEDLEGACCPVPLDAT